MVSQSMCFDKRNSELKESIIVIKKKFWGAIRADFKDGSIYSIDFLPDEEYYL